MMVCFDGAIFMKSIGGSYLISKKYVTFFIYIISICYDYSFSFLKIFLNVKRTDFLGVILRR